MGNRRNKSTEREAEEDAEEDEDKRRWPPRRSSRAVHLDGWFSSIPNRMNWKSTEFKLKREDVKKLISKTFFPPTYVVCFVPIWSSSMWKCTYLCKVHPYGSVCTYVKFIHTLLPSTMVIKVRPKKVIFYDKHLQYLRVMKWCVDSMFKSKVYEHNYNWVFLSSDREAKGIFPKLVTTPQNMVPNGKINKFVFHYASHY